MMPDPDFPIRLRDDGSVDHDFYRGEAARMRVEERRRLFRLVWLQALRAVRRGQRARKTWQSPADVGSALPSIVARTPRSGAGG